MGGCGTSASTKTGPAVWPKREGRSKPDDRATTNAGRIRRLAIVPGGVCKTARGDCGKDGGPAEKCYARNPKPGDCLITIGLKLGGRSQQLTLK